MSMLPQMIPLRLRNQSEYGNLKAQNQYSPFRTTVFSPRNDGAFVRLWTSVNESSQVKLTFCVAAFVLIDGEASRGPGSLFREEWNSMAVNTQKKAVSLYRYLMSERIHGVYQFGSCYLVVAACLTPCNTVPPLLCKSDRDVNPISEPTVQRFYNAHESHDLALQMRKKGNTVSALKSATPRFHSAISETKGPGAYSPEKYHGAFPLLLEKVSPDAAMHEKQLEKEQFEADFAIGPARSSAKCGGSSSPRKPTLQFGKPRPSALHTLVSPRSSMQQNGDNMDSPGSFQTARLVPGLTSRNAYSNANRQLVLAKGSH